MSEILNEIKETQTETEIVGLPQRVNHFCVISKEAIKVEDINGNILYEHKDSKEAVLNKSITYILNELLGTHKQ